MAEVMKTVQQLVPEDTVYTNGAGNFSNWLHRYTRYPGRHWHGRTQLAPTSGAMGYGVPAAVAASLLHPDRTAINIAGDGDFLMTGQELATATAFGAGRGRGKLISVVVDNGTFVGWARTGQSFKAYGTTQSGTSAVCRIYIPPGKGDGHFFGRDKGECDGTMTANPTFILESPSFLYRVEVDFPEAGIWEAVATTLAQAMADNSRHTVDSTTVRAHVSAAGAKGGLANKLLEGRGAGSAVKFIVSVTPEASRSSSTSRPAKRQTARRSKTSSRSSR